MIHNEALSLTIRANLSMNTEHGFHFGARTRKDKVYEIHHEVCIPISAGHSATSAKLNYGWI